MSVKRRDRNGRTLKTGEGRRKDHIYKYRYIDADGKRVTVYSSSLKELREKEKEIQANLSEKHSSSREDFTVLSLVEKYVSLKQGVKYNTRSGYNTVISLLKNEEFGSRRIQDIKVSDAKIWVIKIFNNGYMYSSIKTMLGTIKPAFSMACEEDIIAKSPFNFKLSDVIPNESEKRAALTKEQQEALKDFIKNDKVYKKYYDIFIILLETGLRVSEFCGLTKADLDFAERKIRVDHQLLMRGNGELYAAPTKSKSGIRFIPMTDNVYNSLRSILDNRAAPKTEKLIDGYGGFVFVTKSGNPYVSLHIDRAFRHIMKKYTLTHPDSSMPHVTPHVLRHTFCTNMANGGMDVKSLQYIMGHSDISVTLNVYTHANYERAAEQMAKISNLSETASSNEQKKMV